MSTATLTDHPATERVRFRGLMRSEWIKATSVRAPIWTAIPTVGAAALFAGTVPLIALVSPLEGADPRALIVENFGEQPSLQVLMFVFILVQSLIALMGVLLVSGERGSGLINVTLAAVPSRTPVLVAKLLLSGVVGFAVGLASGLGAILVAQPALAALGMGDSLWTVAGLQVIAGGALSLALIAVVATALASLFSNTAAAAGVVLSLVLIAPSVIGLIPVIGVPLSQMLPSSAAMLMIQPADVVGSGTVVSGLLILLGWVAVTSVIAGLRWKRRDV
ncbi:hypothetical protein [Homoserinimonas sp. A520]